MRTPDFDLFLAALRGGRVSRPVRFEFLMSDHIAEPLAGKPRADTPLARFERDARVYALLGCDFAPAMPDTFRFEHKPAAGKESARMNDTMVIRDRADLDTYAWPEPDERIPEFLEAAGKRRPEGTKLFVWGPGGVLENALKLMGFDNLMFNLYDDPNLVREVFDRVGSRLLRYYELALQVDAVGVIMCNDDWGHKTQTVMSPAHMREYVFGWHKKAVTAAHNAGRPAVLHSCGEHRQIMDDIIDDMGYDGKHSYEDNIQPVEDAYAQYGRRICVMGGMDMDFLCRRTPEEVYTRAKALLLNSRENGHYMLGTGNSLARFLPLPQLDAMRRALSDAEHVW